MSQFESSERRITPSDHLLPISDLPPHAVLATLHSHTFPASKDARLRFGEQIELAKKLGIKVIAKTDHDNFSLKRKHLEMAAAAGITIIRGLEVTTRLPGKTKIPHVLVYSASPEKKLKVPKLGVKPHVLLQWVIDQGDEVFAAFAHPIPDQHPQYGHWKKHMASTDFMNSFTLSEIEKLLDKFPQLIDIGLGIEVMNMYYREYYQWILQFALEHGLVPVGGGDSHKKNQFIHGGGMWFYRDEVAGFTTAAQFLAHIKSGRGGTFYKQADERFG